MANATDLLRAAFQEQSQPPVPQTKIAEVAQASAEKKAELTGLPDPQTFTNAAIMSRTGAGLATATPMEKDLATLPADQILQKYGHNLGSQLIQHMGVYAGSHDGQLASYRSGTDILGDSIIGAGLGVANSIGGVAALGAGLVNNKVGTALSKAVSDLNDYAQSYESTGLQAHREAVSAQNSLEYRDNTDQYEKDKTTDGDFVAGLKRIGRDAITAIKNTGSDPTLFGDTAAQAAGSILTAGPMAKGLSLAGELLVPAATRLGILGSAAVARDLGLASGSRSAELLSKAVPSAMSGSVGLQEAGGAYQQTAADMIQNGKSPDEAGNAGLLAAAIAGPAGMAAGKISEHFLEHPFVSDSLGHAASNVLKETAEEGLQGATGQIAQNVGEGNDWTEGVGEQVGLGALGGFASAAGMQAPSAVGHAGQHVVNAAVDDLKSALKTQTDANTNTSPASDANVAQAGARAQEIAQDPATQDALKNAVEQANQNDQATADSVEPTSIGPRVQALADKVLSLGQFDPKVVDNFLLSDSTKSQLSGSKNRIDMMQKLADVVNTKGMKHDDGIAAALHLNDQLGSYESLLASDKPAFDALDDNSPAGQAISHFYDLSDAIIKNPAVTQALKAAKSITTEQATKIAPSLAPDQLASLATLAPDKVPLDATETALKHANEGTVKLTQEQHQALLVSQSIVKGIQEASDAQKALGHKTKVQDVADDLFLKPGQDVPQGENKRSVVDYATRIFQAMRAGRTDLASGELSRLKELVQLSNNKVSTLNTHYNQGGDPLHYQSLNPDSRQWFKSDSPLSVNPKSRGSVEFAQKLGLEAKRISDIYNGLSKAFPALEGGQTQAVPLHANLQGTPRDVIQAHRSGSLAPEATGKAQDEFERQASTLEPKTTEAVQESVPASAMNQENETNAPLADGNEPNSKLGNDRSLHDDINPSDTGSETTHSSLPEGKPQNQGIKAETTPAKVSEPTGEGTEAKGAEAENTSEKVEAKPAEIAPIEPKAEPEASDKPETQSKPDQETTPEPPKTVKEAHPDLHTPTKGKNWIHEAFKLAKAGANKLVGIKDPVNTLYKALKNDETFRAHVGDTYKGKLPNQVGEAYRNYLRNIPILRDAMNERLQARLNQKNIGKKLADGEPVNQWKELRSLNLVEQQKDGSFAYNKQLLDKALLAGMQWLLTADQRKPEMDAETAAKITGLHEDDVTDDLITDLSKGLGMSEAVRSLSDRIVDYWGFRKNNDVSKSYTDLIPNEFASEILSAMLETKALNETRIPIPQNGREIPRFTSAMPKFDEEGRLNPLFVSPNLIEHMVVPDSPNVNYYSSGVIPVAKTQMRQPHVGLTGEQDQLIRVNQKQAYTLNERVANLYNAIGRDRMLSYLGGGSLEGRKLNDNHKATLDGKNTTVSSSIDALTSRMAEMKLLPEGLKTAIHYAFGISSVGRLQMLGGQTPQGSKYLREAIAPHWANLSLGLDGDPAHQKFFNYVIAQALGIKIHALSLDEINDQLSDKISKLAPSIESLQEHLQGKELPDDFIDQLKADLKAAEADQTAIALHALLEHARFELADDKELKDFRTALYVEADGVTNGVANAINMLTTGSFTPDEIENLAKIGAFFTGSETMNDHRAKDKIDLYQKASTFLEGNIDKFDEKHKDTPVQYQLHALLHVLTALDPDVKINDNGDIVISRGELKNPMTITVYGSQANGIANKLVDKIMEKVYEKTSEALETGQSLQDVIGPGAFDALNQLLVTTTTKENKTLQVSKSEAKTIPSEMSAKQLKEFTLDKAQYKALQQNMKHLFVTQLQDAVSKTMGPTVLANSKLIQNATQTQSIVVEHLVRERIQQKLDEKAKDPSFHKGDFLSENEISKIIDDVLKISPIIDNGSQKFWPVKSSSTEFTGAESRSLTGKFAVPMEVYAPSNAGVKGGPMLNIGMGDAYMIQDMMTRLKALGLPVFDGFNAAIDKIADVSQKANESVFRSWQNNPLGDVSKSFDVFMKHMDMGKSLQNPEMLKALSKSLLPPWEQENPHPEKIMEELHKMQDQLSRGGRDVAARAQAKAGTQMHVDQMAGAQSPYVNTGRVLSGSNADVAKALETQRLEVQKQKPTTQTQTSKTLSMPQVEKLMKSLALGKDQRAILDLVLKSKALQGYQVVYAPGMDPKTQGLIVPGSKMITLHSASPETMIHELIHGATFAAIQDHYNGKTNARVSEAVDRLEGLMQQFLGEDPYGQPNAYFDAVQAIQSNLNQGNKAIALNEYMAWVLANKDLREKAKATEAPAFVRMVQGVINAVKRILGLDKLPNDAFSNLVFNTGIIAEEAQPTIGELSKETLYQKSSNQRLSDINDKFDQMFGHFLGVKDPVVAQDRQGYRKQASINALSMADAAYAQGQGFSMSSEGRDTFERIVTALSLDMQLNGSSMAKMDDLYRHAMKTLTLEDLIDKNDPSLSRAQSIADMKMQVLTGLQGKTTDRQGRSSLLPVFMGLAMVDDGLRDALSKIELPGAKKNQEKGLDAAIAKLGIQGMQALSDKLSGQKNARNVQQALDNMTLHVANRTLEDVTFYDKALMAPNQAINAANDAFTSWVEGLSDKAIQKAEDFKKSTKNPTAKKIAEFGQLFAGVATEKNAGKAAEGLMALMNQQKGWHALRATIGDIIGRTDSNAPLLDLVKLTRSMVQKARQQFREHLPSTIANQFSRKLLASEWSAMHMGMAKADLASMVGKNPNAHVLNTLIDPTLRLQEKVRLEALLKAQDKDHFDLVQRKSDQLAEYMINGNPGVNLLKNAESVANLWNEKKNPKRAQPKADYVQAIDHLTTLYALDKLDPGVHKILSSLVLNENQGMDFTLSYLVGQRKTENDKAQGMAKYNALKGYVPSMQQAGVSLVVADDTKAPELLAKSYKNIGKYEGSKAEGSSSKKSYYFAPVSSRAAFEQGIVQNARQTAGGVDVQTGHSEGLTAGRITNPAAVDVIAKRLAREGASKENLIPVINDKGKIVAFERSLDPEKLVALNQNTHLAKMIGVWRGRQAEELLAHQFNVQTIDALHGIFKKDLKNSGKAAYVDLFDPKSYGNDPVIKDAMSLMPDETKRYIQSVFGSKFMVRKDLVNDAIGYRSASVGDAWNGTTRWSPQTQATVKNLAISVFGNNAFRYLVNAEGALQELVGDAKTLIVVKSIIVPVTNFASNMFQLLGRGVAISDIIKGLPKLVNEAHQYEKSQLRKIDAEAELRAAEGSKDALKQHRLTAEIQTIEDSWKRLSIWPLIKAGEFGAITDLGISRDDVLVSEGRLAGYMERLVGKLPESTQQAARFALITKDLSLFQGLQKSVEYGDFLGKALYYQHLTQRKGMDPAKAMGKTSEEFINFDRLPGRDRGYLESMGMLWFYNYKLRSAKVALSMIRDNPLQSLLGSIIPVEDFGGIPIDSPMGDNIFSKAWNGSLGYSIGPRMLFRSPALHPLAQVMF